MRRFENPIAENIALQRKRAVRVLTDYFLIGSCWGLFSFVGVGRPKRHPGGACGGGGGAGRTGAKNKLIFF